MLKDILVYLWSRRTTVLGYLGVILGVLVTSQDMFSEQTLRWIVLGNSVLLAVLGHYNNSRIKHDENDGGEEQ